MCCNSCRCKRNYLKILLKQCLTKMGKKFWFEVFIYGGKQGTELDAIQWAKKATELGAGRYC